MIWRNIYSVWENFSFSQCGKTRNSLPCHANFFSSNQFIVKFFSETLLSRNFSEKMVAKIFRNFHTGFSTLEFYCDIAKIPWNWRFYERTLRIWRISHFSTLCGYYGNLLSRFFDKNFVKKHVLNSWFNEFFLVIANFSFFHTVLLFHNFL